MSVFAELSAFRPLSQRSQDKEPVAATLRALSYGSRSTVAPLLTEALHDCGCWVRERSGSASGLWLAFELPLREMSELYPSLLECGLEFDRKGHCELALLCTVGRHALEREGVSRNVCLRLELTFADELELVARSTPFLYT